MEHNPMAEVMVALPPVSNTVVTLYTIFAGFQTAPDVGELLEYAIEYITDPKMPYTVARNNAHAFSWSAQEQDMAVSAFITLQQDITTLLQGVGIHNPLSVKLYRQIGYKLILVVKPREPINAIYGPNPMVGVIRN